MARRWIWMSIVLVLAAGCGGDGEKDGAAPASTMPAASSTSTTSRPVDYGRPSMPREAGTGLLEGASLDGSALYVSAVDATLSQRGCGGQPEPVLFRVPLAGGARQAVGAPGEPVRGTILRGADRRVALVAGCEEFLSAVRLGTETPDGQLHDLRRLDLGQLGSAAGLAWSGDGRSLVAVARSLSPSGQATLQRVDPGTGAATPLFTVPGPVTQVGELADGTLVVAGAGRVTLRDAKGAVAETHEGVGFTVAPDRRRLAVWGKALRLVTPGQPATTLATVASPTDLLGPVSFSPDGGAVAFVTGMQASGQVAVVTLADAKVATVPGTGRFVRAVFTGDGRAVAFSRLASRPADEATVLVVRFEE
jgi:hypothetical protein